MYKITYFLLFSKLIGYFGNKDSFNGISPSLDGDISQRVLEAIHAINPLSKEFMQTFKECTDPPFLALQGRDGQSSVEELKHILNHKDNIPILFFNGMDDLVSFFFYIFILIPIPFFCQNKKGL